MARRSDSNRYDSLDMVGDVVLALAKPLLLLVVLYLIFLIAELLSL